MNLYLMWYIDTVMCLRVWEANPHDDQSWHEYINAWSKLLEASYALS